MRRLSSLQLYAIGYLIFLYIPVLFIPLFSFNTGTIVAFPIKGWTFDWYRQLGGEDTLITALMNSLKVGLVSSVVATAIGLFAARAYTRYRFKGKGFSEGLVMLPLVVPGIIVASSMLILFLSMGLKPSLFAVTLGHIFLCIPFAVSILKSAFDDFDISLEEAASDLGSGPIEVFFKVTLPMVLPGIISSILVSFTVSFDEFVLAFFLAGSEPTLPVYIWSQIRFPAKLPNTLALGSVLLFASIAMLILASVIQKSPHRKES